MSTPKENRARVAEYIESALERSQFATLVKRDDDGDRITCFVDGLAVTLVVADARLPIDPNATACPFCGSTNLRVSDRDSKDWEPQRGCLDCDRWIDPVRRRKP